MKTIMYRFTHMGPCIVKLPNAPAHYGPILVGSGEYLVESYERITPDKIEYGPEYIMYRDCPPPWMVS